jgi:5'-nucleotidase
MRILVDMDGPLADYESSFLAIWRERFPDREWISLEDRKEFYIHRDYPRDLWDDIKQICEGVGFFLNLPVIDGAVEALNTMLSLGHKVILCTSPLSSYENCVLEKYQWVDKNLGRDWVNRIHMGKDKTIVNGDGGYLIDDRPIIEGMDTPSWEHVLFDYPYNRITELSYKKRLTWENWREVLEI